MPPKEAVALSWTGLEEAPVILASGKDEIAIRMLELAKSCGISIVEDPVLAGVLSSAEIGSCVPPETWKAVAAIFAFLERGIQERYF